MNIALDRRAALGLLGLSLTHFTIAADWPRKPVRMVVPAAAGSPPDVIARVLSDRLAILLRQQFLVENRQGGSGVVAMNTIKRAAADEHVFLLAQAAAVTVTPHVNASAHYDVDAELAPIAMVGVGPLMMVASAHSGIETLTDFLKIARSRTAPPNLAVTGTYSLPHLTAEIVKRAAGLSVNIVPFSSSGAALTAVLNGDAAALIDGIPGVDAMVKGGRVRPLAVTSLTRIASAPGVAPFADVFPGLEVNGWFVLFGKKETSTNVIQALNAAVNKALAQPSVRSQLVGLGVLPRPLDPAKTAAFVNAERRRWGTLVSELGIKAQ